MAGLSWSHATESSPCCTHFSSTPIAIRPLKRRPGKLRRSPPPVRALLPQPLSSIVDTVAGVAAISSLGLSALPLLTGKAVRANRGRPVNDETEEEDFSFGVMTGVSFLPYANWTVRLLPPAYTRLSEMRKVLECVAPICMAVCGKSARSATTCGTCMSPQERLCAACQQPLCRSAKWSAKYHQKSCRRVQHYCNGLTGYERSVLMLPVPP